MIQHEKSMLELSVIIKISQCLNVQFMNAHFVEWSVAIPHTFIYTWIWCLLEVYSCICTISNVNECVSMLKNVNHVHLNIGNAHTTVSCMAV